MHRNRATRFDNTMRNESWLIGGSNNYLVPSGAGNQHNDSNIQMYYSVHLSFRLMSTKREKTHGRIEHTHVCILMEIARQRQNVALSYDNLEFINMSSCMCMYRL